MTAEIRHRSKNRAKHGRTVFPVTDAVAHDPEMQATIRRLGESVGDINARSVDRLAYVCSVASVIREARRRV